MRPPKQPHPPVPHLPNTGGPRVWIAVVGLLLILLGGWLVVLAGRQERGEN